MHAVLPVLAALTLLGNIRPTTSEITVESVIAQMNVRRTENGLAPYIRDVRLEAAAGDRMSDMEELGYWGHVSPEGRSPFSWILQRGYDFRAAGENLATGFETAEMLVTSWMESRGHRANILSPDFRSVGVAIIEGSSTGRAAGRSVVVLFAAEMVQPLEEKPRRKNSLHLGNRASTSP